MKSGYREIEIILVLTLILSIPIYFTFIYYYSLSEADFLSEQLKLEAHDQMDLLPGIHEKSKASGLINFNHLFFLDDNIYRFLPVILFQTFPLDLTPLILRC